MSGQEGSSGSSEPPEVPDWVKTGRWLLAHVRQEHAVIRQAPLSVLLTAAVLSLGFWWFDKARIGEQISNLTTANTSLQATITGVQADIASKKDKIVDLQTRIDAPRPPAPLTVTLHGQRIVPFSPSRAPVTEGQTSSKCPDHGIRFTDSNMSFTGAFVSMPAGVKVDICTTESIITGPKIIEVRPIGESTSATDPPAAIPPSPGRPK